MILARRKNTAMSFFLSAIAAEVFMNNAG